MINRSDATLADAITHAPFGVVRIGPDLNVMDANPRLALLFLAKAEEMAGSPISRYFSPDEAAWVMHQLRTPSTGSVDSVESETQVLLADRSTIWLTWSAFAGRKADGEIDYYIAMFEERTAKHQAEVAAARNLNVLERLSRLKTEFLTTVSHELRGSPGRHPGIQRADPRCRRVAWRKRSPHCNLRARSGKQSTLTSSAESSCRHHADLRSHL